MRCKACNAPLSDKEMTTRDRLTGDFVELCGYCFFISEEAMLDDDQADDDYVSERSAYEDSDY